MSVIHYEYDAQTGEVSERPLTDAEVQEREAATAAHEEAEAQASRQAARKAVRQKRDRFLAQTDALMLPTDALPVDMPQAVKDAIEASQSEWVSYRQALRDLPASLPADLTDASEVDFPDPPANPPVVLT